MKRYPNYSTRKELADFADVSPETIKKYSDMGLLEFEPAVRGGNRLYKTIATEKRLELIRGLKAKGYSLKLIKDKLK